ncbi:MAG: glycosyltransferase, partial [Bacteroidota bacterium]
MHIALLSDPNNFHTQKWGKALVDAGAQVTVFSFDVDKRGTLPSVRVAPPYARGGRYSYLAYMKGGPRLAAALQKAKVDVVNALNVTPFGVWAQKSGFEPVVASALGADLFEYPPKGEGSPLLEARAWANVEGKTGWWARQKAALLRGFYRRRVHAALHSAALVTGDNQMLVDAARDWFGVAEEKLKLLRWGVEPELFEVDAARLAALRARFGLEEGTPVVLSPRGAKAIYQGDIILKAFEKRLRSGQEKANFIMFSAGYEIATAVLERAAQLEKEFSNFHFIKEVLPREDVYALWNLVDVFVSAPIYDGYSAAVAEGRYIGAVPVVNAIPGNLEVIEHQENGLICDPFDPDSLAQLLGQILVDLPKWKVQFQEKNR